MIKRMSSKIAQDKKDMDTACQEMCVQSKVYENQISVMRVVQENIEKESADMMEKTRSKICELTSLNSKLQASKIPNSQYMESMLVSTVCLQDCNTNK